MKKCINIVEIIRKYMQGNTYVNPQQPANLNDITDAESKLGVKFPGELKDMLLEMNGDEWLLFSAKQILECNLRTREFLSDCYEGLNGLLFIGGNGCGDYFAYLILDNEIKTTDIVRWEHEDNTRVAVANSLEEMIIKYYNDEI